MIDSSTGDYVFIVPSSTVPQSFLLQFCTGHSSTQTSIEDWRRILQRDSGAVTHWNSQPSSHVSHSVFVLNSLCTMFLNSAYVPSHLHRLILRSTLGIFVIENSCFSQVYFFVLFFCPSDMVMSVPQRWWNWEEY